ncbi:MAG: sulfite exporter TauE/SafE family protein, partial [Pedobacter sp.]
GSFFGARLALLKGNKFVRIFFLIVIFGTILRFAYDVIK